MDRETRLAGHTLVIDRPGLALTGPAGIPSPAGEPRPSLALDQSIFFPGLVAGRPVVRSLAVRPDDTSPATWLVDDGIPRPAAPWATSVVPPAMSLSVSDNERVTAIRGTDFLRLGDYAAENQAGDAASADEGR